jgi:hypothetical protein
MIFDPTGNVYKITGATGTLIAAFGGKDNGIIGHGSPRRNFNNNKPGVAAAFAALDLQSEPIPGHHCPTRN